MTCSQLVFFNVINELAPISQSNMGAKDVEK